MAKTVILREVRPEDDAWVVARHGAIYANEEGYGPDFPLLVAGILQGFWAIREPARETGWIAEAAGQPVGCIFCFVDREAGPKVAKLRMFLIEPEARGTGLAQRMIETCMDFARGAGFEQMRLWTHESHKAAGRLYARNGFDLVASTPTHAFGVDVIDQFWQRAL